MPVKGDGMTTSRKIPREWCLQIAEGYAAGISGPKPATNDGVRSTRTIYLILEELFLSWTALSVRDTAGGHQEDTRIRRAVTPLRMTQRDPAPRLQVTWRKKPNAR